MNNATDKKDLWYVADGSVQTTFKYGEKFNYNGIIAINEINGEKIEYPENDLYIEHIPSLIYPGEYEISVEVLSKDITFTYTITVNDIDVGSVFAKAPIVDINNDNFYEIEFENIDLSHLENLGNNIVDDKFASGGKYLQNYGSIGSCIGFKVNAKEKISNAKFVLRMANFAVTMLYPAKNIAIYQNYKSLDDNTKFDFDPDYYLTTRAPKKAGDEGADTSLVWCDVEINNVTLNAGENTFMLTIIGNEAPFLDSAKIIPCDSAATIHKESDKPTKTINKENKIGAELTVEIVESGAVLLRNENNALPLAQNEKVNVFGWSGADAGFIIQGTGSGTGTRQNVVTFLSALNNANIPYNKVLAKKYSQLEFEPRKHGGEAGTDDKGFSDYYGITEASPEFLTEELLLQAEDYSSTAIIVLGRLIGEGNDFSHYQYLADGTIDKTRKTLSLSENEEYLLKTVRERFSKVIVVLNSANPMECGFAEDYNIDALVWLGFPGSTGTTGLANLLAGKASFCGKLTDTYAYDHSTAASYATSGREGVGEYTDSINDGKMIFAHYSDYVEDIYVGYKWYETADAEGYWDNVNNKYGKGYHGVVQYPFGFGLSYTKFDWTILDSNYKNGDIIDKDGKVSVTLKVKNVGSFKGADVIQLYYSAPYTKGGIEKSAINLGAFAKTAVLEPGQHEIITLEMPIERMRSYDCYDKNNNGFIGYELEGGEYIISLRVDCHTLKDTTDGANTISLIVPEDGYKYEFDSVTGNKITNQFTNFKNEISGAESKITDDKAINNQHSCDGCDEDVKIKYLSRADFYSTFTSEITPNRTGGTKLIEDTALNYDFSKDDNTVPVPKWGSTDTNFSVEDLLGVPFEDEKWNQITSQLTLKEAATLVAAGGFGTREMPAINMPRTHAFDGPSGFAVGVFTNFPCSTLIASTWDWNIPYQVGMAIGREGSNFNPKIKGWYGPGANLHRSPMGGRNFEYYSEDPVLSGIICAHHILGAKTQDITAYIKHIAVNDCERFRNGSYKWLTEQNLRETYLLPFEYTVKIGKSNGLMASVDRVGSGQATSSSALLIAVLRKEWGFIGAVVTDYYQGQNINDVDESVRAGCNLMLCPWGNVELFHDIDSHASQNAIFEAAKEIIYAYVETLHYSRTAEKLTKTSVVGKDE